MSVMTFSLDAVLASRAVHCVYRPVVTLDAREVVAYEALSRGPDGTRLVR